MAGEKVLDLASPGVPTMLNMQGQLMVLTEFGYRLPSQVGMTVVNSAVETKKTILVDENDNPVTIGGGSGGTFDGTVTIADGADAAVGAKSDAAVTNPALSASQIALLKGLLSRLNGDSLGLLVQPTKRAGTNRSKLITTASSEVIPANANSWFLANDSTADILINIGAPAVVADSDSNGTFKLRPGERLSSRDVVETGAVNAIVASGTARIKARST